MNVARNTKVLRKVDQKPERFRVLVVSHGHPRITNGGAEIAAFLLFSQLLGRPNIDAWFLGCNAQPGSGRDGIAISQPYSEREFVYCPDGHFDWFRFSNGDIRLPRELKALLIDLRPDVIHLHHYANFGVEIIWTIRKTLPNTRIVLTLHEYQAICNHFGQMVKRDRFSLCDRSDQDACHRCFPEIDTSDFFLRNLYIKIFLNMVDHFISPSQFLLERYVNWGIERSKVSVIENIIAPVTSSPHDRAKREQFCGPLRIGFFGQISKLKGIGVLLECANILSVKTDVHILFDIYGDYKGQPQKFQDEFVVQLGKLSSNVNYRGAYRQDKVDMLMRGVDAVLVPSIWWENSPVVIQEAFRNNCPVICSDIGGMAEKVRDGIDGFHFSVGSGLELSYLLQRLYDDRSILNNLRDTLRKPPSAQDVLAEHLKLYDRLGARVGR